MLAYMPAPWILSWKSPLTNHVFPVLDKAKGGFWDLKTIEKAWPWKIGIYPFRGANAGSVFVATSNAGWWLQRSNVVLFQFAIHPFSPFGDNLICNLWEMPDDSWWNLVESPHFRRVSWGIHFGCFFRKFRSPCPWWDLLEKRLTYWLVTSIFGPWNVPWFPGWFRLIMRWFKYV